MNVGTQTAISKQLAASYEFLFNTLGADHPETWDCWQQYQRSLRSRSTA